MTTLPRLLITVSLFCTFLPIELSAQIDSRQASDSAATSDVDSVSDSVDEPNVLAQAQALKDQQYEVASQLLVDFPDDFDALRVMGFAHSSHGNLEAMAKCWQRCLQQSPNRPDIHDQLGRHAMKAQRYDDAIAAWRQTLAIDPSFPLIQQRIGAALLDQGKAAEARSVLEQQLQLTPNDGQSHYLLGEACFQLQDDAAARASFEKAADLAPQNAQAYYGLIKVCTRLGQGDAAAEYAKAFQKLQDATLAADLEVRRQYDDLRKMREDLAVTYLDAGRVYLRNKDVKRAESLWIRSTRADPNSETAHRQLASLYVKQRRGQEALNEFQQLARLQPRNADNYRQIGFLKARLGDLAGAEAAFKKMVQIAPDHAAGYRSLAKFYLNTGRSSDRAHELSVRAVELEPVADSYFVLGWSFAKLGRRAEAAKALKTAMRMDPNNAAYQQLFNAIQRAKSR